MCPIVPQSLEEAFLTQHPLAASNDTNFDNRELSLDANRSISNVPNSSERWAKSSGDTPTLLWSKLRLWSSASCSLGSPLLLQTTEMSISFLFSAI